MNTTTETTYGAQIQIVRTEIKMHRTTKTIALGDGNYRAAKKCDELIADALKREQELLIKSNLQRLEFRAMRRRVMTGR